MNLKNEAKSINEEIIKWRRDLHRIPEVGTNLPLTAQYVCDRLDEFGIPYQTYEKHSGITCVLGQPGKATVAVRADMDGLLVKEENSCDYASKNDCMHACGHDAHTAILLGLAKLLKQHEKELNGQVKLLFQSGEENLRGAQMMIDDGVLKNPDIDCIFALHCENGMQDASIKPGDILIRHGAVMAASDGFNIEITGFGGHASTPHLSKDAILAATRYVENIQSIVSREIAPWEMATIHISHISAGRSTAYGVIPEKVRIEGNYRAANAEVRKYINQRLSQILEYTAQSMGVTAKFETYKGCSATVNDNALVDSFVASAQKILSASDIHTMPHGLLGGEDMGIFMDHVPGCYFFLRTGAASDDGRIYPIHHPRFSIDESILYVGTALLGQAAVDYLDNSR